MDLPPIPHEQEPHEYHNPEESFENVISRAANYEEYLNSLTDQEITRDLMRDIVQDLDGRCVFLNQDVIFSGEGLFPIIQEGKFVNDYWDNVGVYQGKSNGYFVKKLRLNGESKWHVLHGATFAEYTRENESGTVSSTHSYSCFLKYDSPFMLLSDVESIYYEEPLDVHNYLSQKSDSLTKVVGSGDFQKMTEKQQRDYLDNYAVEVERITAINQSNLSVEAGHCYVISANDKAPTPRLLMTRNILLGGQCLGIMGLNPKEASSGSEVARKILNKSGLCLVLDPAEEVSEKIQTPGLLYVPISGQKIGVVISRHPAV